MKLRKSLAVSAALVLSAGWLTACGGGTSGASSGDSSGGAKAMTFWHNSTTGDGKAYWAATVKDFEAANPGVKITIQAIQNEDMDGKVYGMPMSILPGGIYYSKDLFKRAGITGTPSTMADLEADVQKLKDAKIAPIALGAKDAWPAAHWYYFFALRACSQDTLNKATADKKFDDPCWTKAGDDLAAFSKATPFNKGFLTTTAQQGAGSSAGLLANHQAAMELMGAWDPGVIASLTPDKKPLPDLGWFPFPTVSGGAGAAGAMMGGLDGFSCSKAAPPECSKFLNFAMQKKYQEGYAKAFQTLPASKDAQSVVTTPALVDVLASYNKAPYVSLWLDTLYGQNVGNALNAGVVNMLAGQGSSAAVVKAVVDAAAKG